MSGSLLQKIILDPISSSFLIHFEWLKFLWVHQLGLYKNSLYTKCKDAMIKDLKFEMLINLF